MSVVICAYTVARWRELRRAVESILEQSEPPKELVIVVDYDGELLDRARAAFPEAVVTANQQPPGIAGARNSGVAASTGAVVAFLDDDAEAFPTWIEELKRAYATGAWLGVGGSIVPTWPAGRPRWFPAEFDWVVGCSYAGMPTEAGVVRNLIGANMSVRRDVLEAVGGFRQELGRLEETEFCIRANEVFPDRGWLYWPSACVKHNILRERTQLGFFLRRCFNEGFAKASMIRLTGSKTGLRSERNYVLRALPAGLSREMHRAIGGDASGLARSAAILVGLLLTLTGFLRGKGVGVLSPVPQPVSLPRRGNRP